MEPEGRERVRSLARADGVRLSAALWLTALPVTPFHFGPGLALKGAAAPMFSWSAFAVAQVVIDCETIYYLVKRGYPVHRFFHSFLGAAVAGCWRPSCSASSFTRPSSASRGSSCR
jgi:hypothetical protein